MIDKCNPVIAANLLTGDVLSYLNKNIIKLENTKLTETNFIRLVTLLDEKKISSKQGKDILSILLEEGKDVDSIIQENHIENIDNETVRNMIVGILDNNPDSIRYYKDGKDRAIKYLMGQVMKESKGQADPASANKMLIEELNKK